MPATWTTEPQADFLKAKLPGFLAAQRQQRAPRFLKGLDKRWFQKFPEHDILFPERNDEPLTADENERLGAAVDKQKRTAAQQLKSWMYWFVTKEKRASTKADVSWLKDAISKNKRSPQAIEIYQQRNKESIEQRIKAEVDQQGAKMKTERMRIRRQVLADMWTGEDEDVVAEIKEETERIKAEARNGAHRKGSQSTLGGKERTPEEYNQAVQNLPVILQSALQAVAEATGWVLFVSAAGPHPGDGGHMYMENFYFGPVTPMGEDFENSYDAFTEGFKQPFAAHVRRCFPKHIREARTLKTGGLQLVDDDDEASVKMLGLGAGDPPVTDAPASAGNRPTVLPTVNDVDDVDEVNDFNGHIQVGRSDDSGDNVQVNAQKDQPAMGRGESTGNWPAGMPSVGGDDDDFSAMGSSGEALAENLDHGNDLRTDHRQLMSPIAVITQLPFAPGGPSSPIENAFTRLAASAVNTSTLDNPAAPLAPRDGNIDPVLFDVGNCSINHSSPDDYQLPGAIVDPELAMPPQASRGATKKGRRTGRRNTGSENTPLTQTAAQKRAATLKAKKAQAATLMTKKAQAAEVVGVEEDMGGRRKRKARLNPDGEVFTLPKKARHAVA